jgi:hypothetical protein
MSIFIAFFKRLFLRGQPFVFLGFIQLIISFGVSAQVSFDRYYQFGQEDYGLAIKEAADQSLMITGYTSWPDSLRMAMTVCKLTSNGDLVWKIAPSPGRENFAKDIVPGDQPGTWAVIGSSSDSSGKMRGFWMLIDESGNVLHTQQYYASQPLTLHQGIRAADGYLMCGQLYDPQKSNQFFVIKVGFDGQEIWRRSFGGTANEYFKALILWPEGNGILGVGDTQNGNTPTDVMVVKMNTNGDSLASQRYGNAFANGSQTILSLPSGGYMVLGESAVEQNGPFQFLMMTLDVQGDSVAGREFGGPGSDAIFSGAVLGNGDLVVCGYSAAQAQQPISSCLLRVTPQGQILWLQRYQPDTLSIAYRLALCQDGGFAMIATGYGPPVTTRVIRTFSDGMLGATFVGGDQYFGLSPNPVAFGETVRIEGFWGQQELELTNISGQMVQRLKTRGNAPITFCPPEPGCYIVRSSSDRLGKLLFVTP